MNYEPPVDVKKIHHGCMCCGGTESVAPLTTLVFADDGQITKNGEVVYPTEAAYEASRKEMTTERLSVFEEMALKEPEADWRFSFVKAMRDGVYQRQGEGKWVLIQSGQGYA